MELELNFEIEKQYNEILRGKYEKLVNIEKELHNSPGSRRITQKKIGKAVGISDSYMSFWLSGKRDFFIPTLEKLAEVLLIEEGLLNLRIEVEVKRLEEIKAGRRNSKSE